MKKFHAMFMYQPDSLTRIGPETEWRQIEAKSKAAALREAKAIAADKGWRFCQLVPDELIGK